MLYSTSEKKAKSKKSKSNEIKKKSIDETFEIIVSFQMYQCNNQ